MTVATIDHAARALARLPQQFRGKPKIEALLTSLVGPCAAIETALMELLENRSVDTAVGAQLDVLGKLVGEPRDGLDDATYRRHIRARVAANRSRGNVEDLIKIANLVLTDEEARIAVESRQGTAVVVVTGAVDDDVAGVLVRFLADGTTVGIRLVLESSPVDDSETFTLARVEWLAGAHLAGVTELDVNFNPDDPDLDLWPRSGQLVLDQGTATEETIAYTLGGAGSPFYLATPTAFAHADEGPVVLVGQPGEGLGDSGDAGQPNTTPYSDAGTTGGRLSDART